jgi:hypothetical protein
MGQMKFLRLFRPGILIVALIGTVMLSGTACKEEEKVTPTPGLLEIPRISPAEVKAKLDAGSNLVIVDVRLKEEYERVHVAGSVSIPLGEVADRYIELRGYDEIITYCT